MVVDKSTKRLFCVRIYPVSGPHAIVALFATSANEAETIARGKTNLSAAPASVFECREDETILVTFPSTPTSTAAP
jgi:hypothetical protein